MISFININKTLLIYFLILLIVIPIFGFNFLLKFLVNVLLLIFLIPLLIFLITLISFNSLKSKVNIDDYYDDSDLGDVNSKSPSESIIEVKAEEIN